VSTGTLQCTAPDSCSVSFRFESWIRHRTCFFVVIPCNLQFLFCTLPTASSPPEHIMLRYITSVVEIASLNNLRLKTECPLAIITQFQCRRLVTSKPDSYSESPEFETRHALQRLQDKTVFRRSDSQLQVSLGSCVPVTEENVKNSSIYHAC
jgi:hypothetical protein